MRDLPHNELVLHRSEVVTPSAACVYQQAAVRAFEWS